MIYQLPFKIFKNRQSSIVNRKSSGFTLIELLIVIAIIGILSAGGLAAINPQKLIQQANDTKRKSDLALIQKTLEQAYQDNNGRYPSNPSSGVYLIQSPGGGAVDWGTPWLPYIDVMPKDPSSSKRYVYIPSTDGQAYKLYASLDLVLDSQLCFPDTAAVCTGAIVTPPASCCTDGSTTCGFCNYGVTSPNVSP